MIGEPCTRGSLFLVSTAHLPRRAPTSLRQHCKDCNAYGTLDTRDQERAHKRATVEKLHFGQTLQPPAERPIRELDQLRSFGGSKGQQVWSWIALEHQTRRIVGVAFGERTSETWRNLWQSLPPE